MVLGLMKIISVKLCRCVSVVLSLLLLLIGLMVSSGNIMVCWFSCCMCLVKLLVCCSGCVMIIGNGVVVLG